MPAPTEDRSDSVPPPPLSSAPEQTLRLVDAAMRLEQQLDRTWEHIEASLRLLAKINIDPRISSAPPIPDPPS